MDNSELLFTVANNGTSVYISIFDILIRLIIFFLLQMETLR
jgi:hypothetical protein